MGMIIIKNYSMPHNCYDCDIHNYHECDLTSESIEEDYCWNGDSREKHCPLREVEAIPKADYETRLKADMVAMLTDMELEFEEELNCGAYCDECHESCEDIPAIWFLDFIQEKINALKGKGNNGNNVR